MFLLVIYSYYIYILLCRVVEKREDIYMQICHMYLCFLGDCFAVCTFMQRFVLLYKYSRRLNKNEPVDLCLCKCADVVLLRVCILYSVVVVFDFVYAIFWLFHVCTICVRVWTMWLSYGAMRHTPKWVMEMIGTHVNGKCNVLVLVDILII